MQKALNALLHEVCIPAEPRWKCQMGVVQFQDDVREIFRLCWTASGGSSEVLNC